MIKYILLLLLTTNAYANTKYKPPLPVKKVQQQKEFTKQDLQIIYKSTEFIIELEGFAPKFITDFNGKITIIGHGDCICKNRYKDNIDVIISKIQAKSCVLEWNILAYRKLKKALPDLQENQYVAILAYIFNRGNSYYKTNLFYLTKIRQHRKYVYVKEAKIDLDTLIAKEWVGLCSVKGVKKCPQGMINRRENELKMFNN